VFTGVTVIAMQHVRICDVLYLGAVDHAAVNHDIGIYIDSI